jgi:hypothetical protein
MSDWVWGHWNPDHSYTFAPAWHFDVIFFGAAFAAGVAGIYIGVKLARLVWPKDRF